jgi:hypothetical protein
LGVPDLFTDRGIWVIELHFKAIILDFLKHCPCIIEVFLRDRTDDDLSRGEPKRPFTW